MKKKFKAKSLNRMRKDARKINTFLALYMPKPGFVEDYLFMRDFISNVLSYNPGGIDYDR